MKKFLLMAVVAFGMLATACSKDEVAQPVVGGEESIATFTVEAPVMATRAHGDGLTATDLTVLVYQRGGDLLFEKEAEMVGLKATVELPFVNGMEYDLVFWAEAENSPYDLDKANKSVTYTDAAALVGNSEAYDAFYAYVNDIPEITGPVTRKVELKRPFAQLNIITNDAADAAKSDLVVKDVKVVVKKGYTAFDFVTGNGINQGAVTFGAVAKQSDTTLAVNYLFTGGEKSLVDVEFTYTDVNNKLGTAGLTKEYAAVPVQRNYRTNIVGSLLTSEGLFNIEILPEFEGERNAYVFDPANRTFTVSSVEGFLGLTELSNNWAALFSNGQGETYSDYHVNGGGKSHEYYYKWDWTIKLDADLDLNNITLDAPININEWGRFDGQGHTIKNVKIITANNVATQAGLFDSNKVSISNLVLDNVHVTGSLVGDSCAGILASDNNLSIDNITISNSSVWGGKYTGGVVGYGYTSVTNCTLTNCVVKGGYKLGGVIGYICSSGGVERAADNHKLIGCTVKGADGQYAAGKSEYVMGRVVGNYNCNGTCKNNTVVDMTTDATEYIGKIENNCTVTIENNVMGRAYYSLILVPNGTNSQIIVSDKEGLLKLTDLFANWATLFTDGNGETFTNYANGAGTDFYYSGNWTINLVADIDLNNETIDPIIIKHPVSAGESVFNGNNHQIKNANIVTDPATENAAGLFDASTRMTMKNLKLDSIHVTGSNVGNSTAGILSGSISYAVQDITITNSSVTGGKYTGGVVGYGYTDVLNCKLNNVVVKGGYKLGGLIGYICASNGNTGDVTGNTLTDCEVNGIGGGVYAGGKSEYIIGKLVGNYNCDGTCQNNTVVNMTTDATSNIGQIEANKSVVE